jgi:hypothetical protein
MLCSSPSEKKCRVCPKTFIPRQPMQVVCGLACARRMPILARKEAKAEKQATRARIDELRPLGYWLKQAQAAFNAWIRERDAHRPCVSCGTTKAAWDAGHYLSTGARPELRFDPANVHKQCVQCNQHKSGNAVLFRLELLRRIGPAEVDRLEGPHEPKRYRVDDLKAIRDHYRAELKALQKAAA